MDERIYIDYTVNNFDPILTIKYPQFNTRGILRDITNVFDANMFDICRERCLFITTEDSGAFNNMYIYLGRWYPFSEVVESYRTSVAFEGLPEINLNACGVNIVKRLLEENNPEMLKCFINPNYELMDDLTNDNIEEWRELI